MYARTPRDIGLIVRARRKALGLDQRGLAARAGVSRQWLVEVEKGKPGAELGLVLRTLGALDLVLSLEPEATLGTGANAAIDIDAVVARARGGKP